MSIAFPDSKGSIHREPVSTTYTLDAKLFLEVMKRSMHRFRPDYHDLGSCTFLRDKAPSPTATLLMYCCIVKSLF